ncbi:DUF938 domain-containing protein [Paralimibaculum aggregatum]|uniref:DUF938 domain-containing protein n=1 Tax=Paralimibaculum aggregatum TaxID=3036245 RepID=A0ABQ6LER8_9RHOB|nr:DUF938 domain-containing protein [Limibaculum sp. NKW23]GMG80891.1 DUF938 domain-containing protein [Limibaculum sp. NKW23]
MTASPPVGPPRSNPRSVEAGEGRLSAPAAERNMAPVRAALAPLLAGLSGTVLEVGSGTGQHAADWAAAFPGLDWQPSDPDPLHLASIAAWRAGAGLANLRAPLALDVTAGWPETGPLAGVICLNVIHIAPWPVAEALVAGAGARVVPGGRLILYGPFREAGRHTAPSNESFDASLRARDPRWGVRDLEAVAALAAAAGFGAPDITRMPANNLIAAFRRG